MSGMYRAEIVKKILNPMTDKGMLFYVVTEHMNWRVDVYIPLTVAEELERRDRD